MYDDLWIDSFEWCCKECGCSKCRQHFGNIVSTWWISWMFETNFDLTRINNL